MAGWKRSSRAFLAAAPALFIVSASCTTGSGPPASDTGVEVHVLKWPTQPVAREGESDTAPVGGALVRVEPSAGGGAMRGTTDSAGIARVPVPPGTHRVSVERCPGAMSLPKEAEIVSVAEGAFASITLVCDTGIR